MLVSEVPHLKEVVTDGCPATSSNVLACATLGAATDGFSVNLTFRISSVHSGWAEESVLGGLRFGEQVTSPIGEPCRLVSLLGDARIRKPVFEASVLRYASSCHDERRYSMLRPTAGSQYTR